MNKTEIFKEISRVCFTSDELEIALFKVVEESMSFLKADGGSIYLLKDKGIFRKVVSCGTIEFPDEIEKGKGGLGFSLLEERSVILSPYELPEIKGISSSMIVPLYDKLGLRAIFCLFRSYDIFNENDLSLFSQIGGETNLCLELFRVSKSIYEDVLFSIVKTLSSVIESVDPYLRGHSWNMARYAVALASYMNLPKIQIDAIKYAALLHGIGRIGIPDRIWKKEGPLSPDELRAMRSHVIVGEKIVKNVRFPFDVASIVRSHHENYDGSGYPDGLKGQEIPLGARILSLANAWDAMTSERVFRKGKTISEALIEIKNKKGTQFDPEITDVFLSMIENG